MLAQDFAPARTALFPQDPHTLSARDRFFQHEVISALNRLRKQGVQVGMLAADRRPPNAHYVHCGDLEEVPGLRLKHLFNEFRGGYFYYARLGTQTLAYEYLPSATPSRAPVQFAKLLQSLAKLAPELKFERVPLLDAPDASTTADFLKWTASTEEAADVYENIARQVLNSRCAGSRIVQWSADENGEMSFAWKKEKEPALSFGATEVKSEPTAECKPAPSTGVLGVKRVRPEEPVAPPPVKPTIVLNFKK